MECASGEYITFLGADDKLHKQGYEILYHSAKKNNAEISMGKITLFNSK